MVRKLGEYNCSIQHQNSYCMWSEYVWVSHILPCEEECWRHHSSMGSVGTLCEMPYVQRPPQSTTCILAKYMYTYTKKRSVYTYTYVHTYVSGLGMLAMYVCICMYIHNISIEELRMYLYVFTYIIFPLRKLSTYYVYMTRLAPEQLR